MSLRFTDQWWDKTHYHKTQSQCDTQVTTVYFPQVLTQSQTQKKERKKLDRLITDCWTKSSNLGLWVHS